MQQNNLQLAMNEDLISGEQLLLEIAPLIEEYFLGSVLFDGQCISYQMPNGQIFNITAKAV